MLAMALLPTFARALAQASTAAQGWGEVCTPQGLRSIQVAEPGRDAPPGPANAGLEHCALCTLAADHPGLLPVDARPGLHSSFASLRRATAGQSDRTLSTWHLAQPRGPPAAA